MRGPVKVGVIGVGEVAQIIHLPILRELADRFEIAALCDVSPGVLHAIGERYGVERRYADVAELVAQPDLEAVLVLTNDEYHAAATIAALRYGKHVLVEKPICVSLREAEEIVAARDAAGAQVMVGYMRRFAPAFIQAVAEVKQLGKISYVRVRDIIGPNRSIIEQSSYPLRLDDISDAARQDRAARAQRLVREAIGEVAPDVASAYRLLLGLGSHDLSAMRELIGVPHRVVAAAQWNGGRFLNAIFAYDGYCATFEMGIDRQRRFDALIEVYGDTKSLRIEYDTPFIRHLPTTLTIEETIGEAFNETVIRPTFKDPYTYELEHFYDVVVGTATPKTTPEDSMEDLRLAREIVMAFGAGAAGGD